MNDCIFCKLISGEFQPMKVYEDEHTLVFMDRHRMLTDISLQSRKSTA